MFDNSKKAFFSLFLLSFFCVQYHEAESSVSFFFGELLKIEFLLNIMCGLGSFGVNFPYTSSELLNLQHFPLNKSTFKICELVDFHAYETIPCYTNQENIKNRRYIVSCSIQVQTTSLIIIASHALYFFFFL